MFLADLGQAVGRFELACVGVVGLTLYVMTRTRAPREVLGDYAVLAVAAWIGEETCVRFYRFYGYAPGWHAFVLDVPLLVPLIWPLVVISARDVAGALLERGRGAGSVRRAALAGAVVALDASLVEVIAVRAKLWAWVEPGHLGVPIVGVLGWGFFAFGATLLPRERRIAGAACALVATHALVLLAWWGLFRWTARGELGLAGYAPWALAAAGGVVFAARARRAERVLRPEVWGPRVVAASLFFAVLVLVGGGGLALWAQVALVAAPYLTATAGPRAATTPSRSGTRARAPSPGA